MSSRAALVRIALLCTTLAWQPSGAAAGVYQQPEAFVSAAFGGEPPEPATLWIDAELRAEAERILGHRMAGMRLRYWIRGARSAWILDEIGKEHPITTGIVIEGDAIAQLRVLIFRESRGWEVRLPFFSEQFVGARTRDDDRLDRRIDNISGATLSVRAVRKQARLALALHRRVTGKDTESG